MFKCSYCGNKKIKNILINWEGLKGYPICKNCISLKKNDRLENYFIQEQLKRL